ncbi:MAG: DUF2079 domain-containing protein [Candidatus Omnitrophica bacterium]|nr:DUF2079 domain-containing protein [Candidatus Omnitrophota bacterium]
MKAYSKNPLKNLSLKHFFFILFLSLVIINYIIGSLDEKKISYLSGSFLSSLILIVLCASLVYTAWIKLAFYFGKQNNPSFGIAAIILMPGVLLLFINHEKTLLSSILPIAVVILTQLSFFVILNKGAAGKLTPNSDKIIILSLAVIYFCFFSFVQTQKFNNFDLFNPNDYAIYNQTLWNTSQGRIFINSTYGSNFACHNSWFLFLLTPLYYLLPHPLTLSIIKILLLSLSCLPLYLIAKDILGDIPVFPAVLIYLLNPFIVSQNLIPPHPICFIPFFILFAYYFFRRNKFAAFISFLLICLSIKESLSLIALSLGLYSLASRKAPKWSVTLITLGVIWGIFSTCMILHFQKLYSSFTPGAWFLTILKTRYLSAGPNLIQSIISGLSWANIGNLYGLMRTPMLILPLGIIPALLSPLSLLGLPELILNLLSDRPASLSPLMHYNIVGVSFLFIGALEGIKKISSSKLLRKIAIDSYRLRLLLCVFTLCSTILFYRTWADLARYSKNTTYVKITKEALSLIPRDAFVSIPQNIAVHVSNRETYSLITEDKLGDYVLADKKSYPYLDQKDLATNYQILFNKKGVILFKRKD